MVDYISVKEKDLSEELKKEYETLSCGFYEELKQLTGSKGCSRKKSAMLFLAFLLDGLYDTQREVTTRYAADMEVLVSYWNTRQDWHQKRALTQKTKIRKLEKAVQQLEAHYERQAKAIQTYLTKRSVAEAGKETNLDAISGLAGEMLAEIFDFQEDEHSEELRCIGYYIGKSAYLMEVYKNMERDAKHGVYNPLLQWKKDHKDEDPTPFVRLRVESMIDESRKAYERLTITRHREILERVFSGKVIAGFFSERKNG